MRVGRVPLWDGEAGWGLIAPTPSRLVLSSDGSEVNDPPPLSREWTVDPFPVRWVGGWVVRTPPPHPAPRPVEKAVGEDGGEK